MIPEGFINELFRARHGLLAVRTMAALSGAIYGRMASLTRIPPGGLALVADIADQFDRVRAVADGEKEYLQGVIEFYQTVLTINAALVGQAQNVEVKRLTEASYAQNEEIKKISAWAAIFFAPTLIGTIYGMNFDHMPELHWSVWLPLGLDTDAASVRCPVRHVQAAALAVSLRLVQHLPLGCSLLAVPLSGKPWAATTQVLLPQGDQRILLEPRGSRRLPSQSLVDLRVARPFQVGEVGTVDLMWRKHSRSKPPRSPAAAW